MLKYTQNEYLCSVTIKNNNGVNAIYNGGTINITGGTITSRDYGIHCWQNSGKLTKVTGIEGDYTHPGNMSYTFNAVKEGKKVVVAGYGWCGKGVAMRANALGAQVIVTEIDPIKAMEARMDGFSVMEMTEAAKEGDFFVTVTGCKDVITEKVFNNMKDGAICCNAGHFNVEINIPDLQKMAVEIKPQRNNILGYVLPDGRTISIIAEGRLVNLAAGDGHPAEIMDMSFSIQALCAEYIVKNNGNLPVGVVDVPEEIDKKVALRKLNSWGTEIDKLTDEQEKYINSWNV